eukprot:gb/GECG01012946.1/.p1 GENE.gb/GECG01012946.1/~~gb/GECG01012946.1/.p1  ORF type:complete len:130 (+),score=8.65 gb/GECG01012946.1/:1-390(+)
MLEGRIYLINQVITIRTGRHVGLPTGGGCYRLFGDVLLILVFLFILLLSPIPLPLDRLLQKAKLPKTIAPRVGDLRLTSSSSRKKQKYLKKSETSAVLEDSPKYLTKLSNSSLALVYFNCKLDIACSKD